MRLAMVVRNLVCTSMVSLFNQAGPPGKIDIRTGSAPTNTDDADAGTLLGTLFFSYPSPVAFGSPVNGVATANPITPDSSADNSGTVGHARLKTGGGTLLFDCTCGQGTGDISFDNGTIVAGGVIAISSMTITV